MDSKTLTTVVVVFLCVLFFPVFIAVAGGLIGVLGAVAGGFAGIVGGIFGAIFGVIGGILSFFGWIFESGFHCAWPFHFSGGRMIAVFLAVLVVVMISRSRKGR
jgi:hypothetical protein